MEPITPQTTQNRILDLQNQLKKKDELIQDLIRKNEELTMELKRKRRASVTDTEVSEADTQEFNNREVQQATDSILPPLPPPPSLQASLRNCASFPSAPSAGSSESFCVAPPVNSVSLPSLPPMMSSILCPPALSVPLYGLPNPPPLNMPLMPTELTTRPIQQPSRPLKNCHIAAILCKEKIESTVWEEVEPLLSGEKKAQLQQLYYEPKIFNRERQLIRPLAVKEHVRLLDIDRFRGVEIVLTKLTKHATVQELCDSLMSCQGKHCCVETLECLEKILPKADEISKIMEYAGDPSELALPQTFFRCLNNVPKFKSRVRALIVREIYRDLCKKLEDNVSELIWAFVEVRNNQQLKHLLEVTLAVCNYLNGNGTKGGAWGFKLNSLERIEQTRSPDGEENLAYFIVRQIESKFSGSQYFDYSLVERLRIMTKTSVRQCQADLEELRLNYLEIQEAIKSDKKRPGDNIARKLKEVKPQVDAMLQKMKNAIPILERKYQKCAGFYCEDDREPSDEFGKKIIQCMTFICRTQEAVREIDETRRRLEIHKAECRRRRQSEQHHPQHFNSVKVNPESQQSQPSFQQQEHLRKINSQKLPSSNSESSSDIDSPPAAMQQQK